MYRDDNDAGNGVYTYTGLFAANTYFKLCALDNLGSWSKMYCDGGGGVLDFGDLDSFHIDTEGYYTVTINVSAMTYSITTYDVSSANVWAVLNFVGDFCNWGDGESDPDMAHVTTNGDGTPVINDQHNWKWEGTIDPIGYGVKFRANQTGDNKCCPRVSTDSPFGVADYNPSADPNIDLGEQGAGDYIVWFNDLTGHYIVKRK
jgi:hypothetical protein